VPVLEAAAVAYLARYAASAEQLRRVLMRRVAKAVRAGMAERPEGAALVDAVVARLLRQRLLDDRGFAEGRARSLHRRGLPLAGIAAALGAKGVAREDIDAALTRLREEEPDADLAAALADVERRRLAPYRPPAARAHFQAKDLAALARAGFSYEIARAALAASVGEG
jgi:regulatory protein